MNGRWSKNLLIGLLLFFIALGLVIWLFPAEAAKINTFVQAVSAVGILSSAVLMARSVREMRMQTEQHRQLWEKEREVAAKPLPVCLAAWFDGTTENLGVRLANNGRPLVDSKRSLVLGDLASAIAFKDKGSNRVSGEVSESPPSVRKRDMEAGSQIEAFFEGHSIRAQGNRFTIIIEYWDLEGRAYMAGGEFRTELDTPGTFRVDRVNMMPPSRAPNKDRR